MLLSEKLDQAVKRRFFLSSFSRQSQSDDSGIIYVTTMEVNTRVGKISKLFPDGQAHILHFDLNKGEILQIDVFDPLRNDDNKKETKYCKQENIGNICRATVFAHDFLDELLAPLNKFKKPDRGTSCSGLYTRLYSESGQDTETDYSRGNHPPVIGR